MSRSRLTVILYSAACAATASAANDAPAIAVRAVMPAIRERRPIAYSLRFPNHAPPLRKSHLRQPGGLAPTLHVYRSPAKGARQRRARGPASENGKRQGPSSRLDIRGLYHLRPGRKLGLDSL